MHDCSPRQAAYISRMSRVRGGARALVLAYTHSHPSLLAVGIACLLCPLPPRLAALARSREEEEEGGGAVTLWG